VCVCFLVLFPYQNLQKEENILKKNRSEKALVNILGLLDVLEEQDVKKLSFILSQKMLDFSTSKKDFPDMGTRKKKVPVLGNSILLYSAILSEFKDAPSLPESVYLLDVLVIKLINKSSLALDKALESFHKKPLPKTQRLKFYRLFCELAIAKLDSANSLPTLKKILGYNHSFLSLLDWAFPSSLDDPEKTQAFLSVPRFKDE